MSPPPKLTLPVWLAGTLSLLAGVAQVLNQTVIHTGSHFWAAITIGLVFLAGLGIPAVSGNAFQSLLARLVPAHWLKPVHVVLIAAISAGTLAITLAGLGDAANAIIAGVVTVLAGLGFGPDVAGLPALGRGPRAVSRP